MRIAATAVAVWVAAWLVPGISVGSVQATDGSSINTIITLVIIAVVIGLVNAVVKPIVTGLSGCLILLTLGLFLLLVNAAMLMFSAWLCAQFGVPFVVDGWTAALFGSIIISIVSGLINGLTGAKRED